MFLLQGCTTYTQRLLLRSSTETWSPEMVGGSFFHPDFAAYFFTFVTIVRFFAILWSCLLTLNDFVFFSSCFDSGQGAQGGFYCECRIVSAHYDWALRRLNCLILCSCLKETQAWDSTMFFNGSVVGTSASYQKPIFVLVGNSTF